jgi:hypothetical protein
MRSIFSLQASSPVSTGSDVAIRIDPELPTTSNVPAILGPVQRRLALARPARRVAWLAVLLDLCNVAVRRPI